jgi:hypothetical protein
VGHVKETEFIYSIHVGDYIEDQGSLDRGEFVVFHFTFPKPPCFGEKAVPQVGGIPKLGSVGDATVTKLSGDVSHVQKSRNMRHTYASPSEYGVHQQRRTTVMSSSCHIFKKIVLVKDWKRLVF